MEEECVWYDLTCHVGDWITGIGESATDKLAKSVAGSAQWALELTGDYIVNISGLTSFNQTEATWVHTTLSPYVALTAVVAVIVAGISVIWNQRGEPARELLASLIRLVLVSGAAMTGIILATQAADELAIWLITSSGGSADFMANMASFIKLNKVVAPFVIILAGIVAIIGALIQVMLLLVRGVFLTLLMGVLPLTAAASNTSWGQDWFKKASTWVIAFIVYKPAIAIILALGYRLMGSPTAAQATISIDEHIRQACGANPYDMSRPGASNWGPHNPFNLINEIGLNKDQWSQCADGIREQLAGAGLDTAGAISFLQGLIIVCFAAFAMPALIRFIMPATAAMSSGGGATLGAFAGGAASLAIAGGARHLGSLSNRGSGGSGPSVHSSSRGGPGSGGPSGASATTSADAGNLSGASSTSSSPPGSSPTGATTSPSGAQGSASSGQASAGGSAGPSGASGVSTAFIGAQMGAEVASGISNDAAAQAGDEA